MPSGVKVWEFGVRAQRAKRAPASCSTSREVGAALAERGRDPAESGERKREAAKHSGSPDRAAARHPSSYRLLGGGRGWSVGCESLRKARFPGGEEGVASAWCWRASESSKGAICGSGGEEQSLRAHRNLRLRISPFALVLVRELASLRELRPLRRERDRDRWFAAARA